MICCCYLFCGRTDEYVLFFFFFQAEDGIRDGTVTGVQTCALPIWVAIDAAPETQGSELLSTNTPSAESISSFSLLTCNSSASNPLREVGVGRPVFSRLCNRFGGYLAISTNEFWQAKTTNRRGCALNSLS